MEAQGDGSAYLSSSLIDDEVKEAEMMWQNEILLNIEHVLDACDAHFTKVRRELSACLAKECAHCIALTHLNLPPVTRPIPERIRYFHRFVSRARILLLPLTKRTKNVQYVVRFFTCTDIQETCFGSVNATQSSD